MGQWQSGNAFVASADWGTLTAPHKGAPAASCGVEWRLRTSSRVFWELVFVGRHTFDFLAIIVSHWFPVFSVLDMLIGHWSLHCCPASGFVAYWTFQWMFKC